MAKRSSHRQTSARQYDLSEIKPVFWIFGVTSIVMGLAAIIAFGSVAHFAWALLIAGIFVTIATFFIKHILVWIAGPADAPDEEEYHQIVAGTPPQETDGDRSQRVAS